MVLIGGVIKLHPVGHRLARCGIEQDGGRAGRERGVDIPEVRTVVHFQVIKVGENTWDGGESVCRDEQGNHSHS